MKIDLSGMNILVTGASRGIGREIARELGLAGASVAIHYLQNKEKAEELARSIGNRSAVFQADLGQPEQCLALFDDVAARYKQIHVLINNAGIFLEAPLQGDSGDWLKKWQQTIQVNLTATGLLCRQALLHFQKNCGGRIINISSRAAFRGDDPDYLAYAAAKGGIVSLTRSIARGFGKQGITAFLIAPGFVQTDMAESFFKIHGQDKVLKQIALPTLTEPQHVAPMVAFLASGLADHATGCTIDINAASYVH